MAETFAVDFEGRTIEAHAGESLAAALTAAGVRAFRTTRLDNERGMFCGMGVCQDCLVEVDGHANQRACMVKVDRPMSVAREAHLRPLPARPAGLAPRVIEDVAVETPEVLVVGAGPGGLSAAIAASRAGAKVVLLDERGQPGGQYYKQLSTGPEVGPPPDAQHRAGAALVAEARAAGVDIRSGSLVWGAFEPREFAASDDAGTRRFEPSVAIVATGAYERGWPVPGWTLPGVMTTGAAQTLWRTARRLPGKRVVIAGNGPLNLQLAAELLSGGATVVAVVEAAAAPGVRNAADLLAMAASAPGLIAEGIRYARARQKGGARMIHGMVVGGVEQAGGGLAIELKAADGGSARERLEADVLCLGYGFEPSNELLRALGCGHDFDPVRRQLVTRRNAAGETDVEGVFALGDCTGLGGAKAALAEGTLAGLAAAERLGRTLSPELLADRASATKNFARHRRFQAALWRLYAAPAYSATLATADTHICRCEEVSFGDIEQAIAEGMSGIGAVKRRTRAGMGRCQGRYCAPVLDALLGERFGRDRDEFSGFAPRVPVKPISIEALARLDRP
jgi:thioredoxin reductase